MSERMGGISLCVFLLTIFPSKEFSLTGLSRGGQQVNKARDTYTKAVKTLVELASLQVCTLLGILLSDSLLTISSSYDRLLSLCWMKSFE